MAVVFLILVLGAFASGSPLLLLGILAVAVVLMVRSDTRWVRLGGVAVFFLLLMFAVASAVGYLA